MIHSIDEIFDFNEIKTKVFELNLHPHDTIVIEFDLDEYGLDTANSYFKSLSESYPDNNFIMTFKGIEIKGIIHNGGVVNV